MAQPSEIRDGFENQYINGDSASKFTLVRRRFPERLIGPILCMVTIGIYWIAAIVGLRFVLRPEGITSLWPASGVALALIALTERRRWFWVLLGVALANMLTQVGVKRPIQMGCFFMLANVAETLLAGCILTRFGRDRIDFSRVGHHLRLFIAAGPANALTAALATWPVVHFRYVPHFWEFWRLWFVADGLGILLLTPAILSARAKRHEPLSTSRIVEATSLLLAAGMFAIFIFLAKRPASSIIFDLPFVITIPLILWAALRTSVGVTSWISLIFSTIAIIGTLGGHGPFAGRGGSVQNSIVSLQIVIMAWTICGLIVSVSTVRYRQALHNLEDREARFRLLAANSPAAVFLTDSNRQCIYINKRWEEITGQSTRDALGRGWIRTIHPDDLARLEEQWRTVGAASGDYLAEYRVCRPSGELRWITRRLAPICSQTGVLQGFVGVAIDATDRIRMEGELENRLQFEILIADISNALVNISTEELDPAIERSLKALCELLDVDRATLSERSADKKHVHIIRAYVSAGAGRDPMARTEVDHPWLWQQMDENQVVAAARLDELPPEASVDRETLARRNTKSFIVVPLTIGGRVRFAFSVATVRNERQWPPDLARQLRVLGETIANSIIRADADVNLRQRESMLRRLNAELLRAEENERRRLASALHDELAQSLFAATARLVAVCNSSETNGSIESIKAVISILDESLRQTRDLTFELCPPILYERGLVAALGKLTEQFHRRLGLTCRIDADAGSENLDSELASLLYQAVRELLMNVVKHSGTKAAEIRIVHADDSLRVIVSDAGRGIRQSDESSKNLPSGFGLFNIRERLGSLGGGVEITSNPDAGCSVCLTVPGISVNSPAME